MTRHHRARLACASLVAGWLQSESACSDASLIIAEYRRPGSNDAGSPDTPTAKLEPHESSVEIAAESRETFCARHGPALQSVALSASGEGVPVCTAGIGRRLFAYALCTCGDMSLGGGTVSIDAFDSRQGPFDMPQGGSAIGSNGALEIAAAFGSIGGTTIAAGSTFHVTGPKGIGGDVKTNAALDLSGYGIGFDRDLWVNGDIQGLLTVGVGRDVYQSPGHTGADTLSRRGMLYTQPVAIHAPCPCDDKSLLDIAGLVTTAQTRNDNAALGLASGTLGAALNAGDVPAGFTCGRFAVSGLSTSSDIARGLSGHSALFVAGDLTLGADFAADLATDVELDVFVTGTLRFAGPGRLGTPAHPSALRVYVAGADALTLTDANPVSAQLYAPRAPLIIDNVSAAVFGSIVAARLETRSTYVMHYDRAIVDAGEECSASGPTPATLLHAATCQPCPSGLAAVNGHCGACSRDSDCCEPQVCANGACQPLVLPRQ